MVTVRVAVPTTPVGGVGGSPESSAAACTPVSRARGSRCSSPAITAPSGPRVRVVGTSALTTAAIVAAVESRENGPRPCTAYQSVAPRLHRSDAGSAWPPSSRSGAM